MPETGTHTGHFFLVLTFIRFIARLPKISEETRRVKTPMRSEPTPAGGR